MKRAKLVPDIYKVPRSLRVESLVSRALSQVIAKYFPEILAITQISRVQMSACLAHATVYITSADEHACAVLTDATPKIRHLLGRTVRMRRVPELRFLIDKDLAHQMRINELLS